MVQSKLKIGIVGGFQMGKSTLVNCLLDDKVAKTGGMGVAVTSIPTRYCFGEIQKVEYISKGQIVHTCRLHEFLKDDNIANGVDEVLVSLWKPILKNIDIVDTPGFKANDKDTNTTNEAINKLDFVVVLLNNKGMDDLEAGVFKYIHKLGKPFMVIMNCMNTGGVMWDPNSDVNRPICQEVFNRIKAIGATPLPIDNKPILMCNLMWQWFASEHYLSDLPEQVQQITMQTEFYIKNFLKMPVNSYDEISRKSNFSLMRNIFESDTFFGFPINYIKWTSQLTQELNKWENNINKVLKELYI